ncbi:ATP-dependent DNA helicase RecG [Candidatus Desantisbacteria bacterium]|nr:ATP-dependent DNA helicase RecG [Candidatus Desantisbacteria bacterium]
MNDINSKDLDTPVQYIKGVGPKRASCLKNLNIITVQDMIFFPPRDYDDRKHIIPIKNLAIGQKVVIHGKVISTGEYIPHRSNIRHIFKAIIGDNTGFVEAVWFNQPYLKDVLKKNSGIVMVGKIELNKFHRPEINSPEYEILDEDEESGDVPHDNVNMGRIVPIYPLTGSLTQKFFRKTIFLLLSQFTNIISDVLPADIIQKYSFLSLSKALYEIHFPSSFDQMKKSRERMIYEEFFLLELALGKRRAGIKVSPGISFSVQSPLITGFSQSLPFSLTDSQKKVLDEILADMKSPRPMLRLLQGDVGSGKTIIAVFSMLIACTNDYQSAIMAPTEILAEQHYRTLCNLLLNTPIKVALLAGKIKKKEKDLLYQQIQRGEIKIIVGTQALIQEKVIFNKLGLIIIDEQHRFGVVQRNKLAQKGLNPDTLVMTATPIPRTLAITLYGDMDVSIINELPPGRTPPLTRWSNESKRNIIYDFMRKEITLGRQVYIVYPLIDESEKMDLKAATIMAEHLSRDIFPEFKAALLHSKMKTLQKEQIMRDFKENKISILVSTTVIEVGIDVPNASIMLIEHAERFGLAQLHQLRGRIGRGSYKSYCILLTGKNLSEESILRLKIFTSTADGFKIAEEDLLIRGPGEFVGTRQHGIPEFKFANLVRDGDILSKARRDAFEIINNDIDLSSASNLPLKKIINTRLKDFSV